MILRTQAKTLTLLHKPLPSEEVLVTLDMMLTLFKVISAGQLKARKSSAFSAHGNKAKKRNSCPELSQKGAELYPKGHQKLFSSLIDKAVGDIRLI